MFYYSLHDKPDLLNMSDYNLTVTGPDGRSIQYIGLIEVTVKADFMQGEEAEGNQSYDTVLVLKPDKAYVGTFSGAEP